MKGGLSKANKIPLSLTSGINFAYLSPKHRKNPKQFKDKINTNTERSKLGAIVIHAIDEEAIRSP